MSNLKYECMVCRTEFTKKEAFELFTKAIPCPHCQKKYGEQSGYYYRRFQFVTCGNLNYNYALED